jgi:nucleotide-binding universal stress UspA family protein
MLLERIGRRDGVEVTALSVSDLKGIEALADLEDPVGPVTKSRTRAAEVLDQMTEGLTRAGFAVVAKSTEGNAAAEILNLLIDDPHDITLVGAGNKTWLDRLVHGSTSTPVLHSAPNAAIVVHQASRNGASVRVLFAEDGSDHARRARELVIRLADPDCCDITVLGVVTLVDLAIVQGPSGLKPETMPTDLVEASDLENRQIAFARERVERAVRQLREAGFQTDGKTVVGHPATEILKRAELGRHDLVVMGSRGRGTVGRAFLGSVSDQVSRHARATLVAR